jgi:acetyl esterase/lipase
MRLTTLCTTGAIALGFLATSRVYSQTLPRTIDIWPGVAPGSESWKQKEIVVHDTPVGTVVLDVVKPTLTIYLPDRGRATGAGVIIAPGGYCVALAIDLEANDVARALQKMGVAAFVLKYRTIEKRQQGVPTNIDMDETCKYGIADGIKAIAVVRKHAAEWNVSPNKIGIMGFSAGGMIASGTLFQQDVAVRPDFAALIYGAPFGVMPAIPSKLPPIFMAWAQDDTVARRPIVKFYDALTAAGQKPEAHVFSAGGHGFGLRKQGTTSAHWIDEFRWWLDAQKITHAANGTGTNQN